MDTDLNFSPESFANLPAKDLETHFPVRALMGENTRKSFMQLIYVHIEKRTKSDFKFAIWVMVQKPKVVLCIELEGKFVRCLPSL